MLVLAISGTSLLQVVRRAGYSSNGYAAHLESFYRAERALRAAEIALVDLVHNCLDALEVCSDYDTWIKINNTVDSEIGRNTENPVWKNHPHSSAARGQVAYVVEFVEQGSFEDSPAEVYDIYRVSVRAGGPSYAAYSSLTSMIAICVPTEIGVIPSCKKMEFRGNWKVSAY